MNWTNIISDLSVIGMTQKEIADYCDCGQSTISDIFTGGIKTPSYSLGVRLISLHTQKIGASDTANSPQQEAA